MSVKRCSEVDCARNPVAHGLCDMHYRRAKNAGVLPTNEFCGVHPLIRLWNRIVVDEHGCWVWTGSGNGAGYGRISVGGHRRYTHRFAYEAYVGPIPEGYDIDHLCRNPACCNPDHLEAVTHGENVARGNRGARELVCKRGHWKQPGGGDCMECDAERNRAKRKRYRDLVARNDPSVPHGKAATYANWGCRCEPCTAAWRKKRSAA